MTSHTFNIGAVEELDQSGAEADSIAKNIEGEKMYQWTGNVGLVNVSDILRASTNPLCTSVTTSYNDTDSCNSNYLLDSGTMTIVSYWTINAFSHEYGFNFTDVWYASSFSSSGRLLADGAYNNSYTPRPVVFLKSDITLSGLGTQESPYVIV